MNAPRWPPARDSPQHPGPLWRHVLGDRLRGLRHESGKSLGEVARRAGVSPQYLSEIERGLKEPSSEMIAAVMRALGITLVDLTLDIAESLIAAQQSVQPVSLRQSTVALAA
ncbi:helix-turn-helix transcriptional regulator [Microbacterium sp. zg-YB36]|uniref:helix-turn-helix domain-containing protein n=1 Tax=Microbacterium sp. zg-YB36 TaxID=2969407 RepID=UPI00214B25AC|nr:helix-turn-helix transcriptional regulator [Microbacterium sp. zg-YB36]MDL5350547.1 helix-turn-helix transcriptional regulator [Microbacterium sp. zg-YB36]